MEARGFLQHLRIARERVRGRGGKIRGTHPAVATNESREGGVEERGVEESIEEERIRNRHAMS